MGNGTPIVQRIEETLALTKLLQQEKDQAIAQVQTLQQEKDEAKAQSQALPSGIVQDDFHIRIVAWSVPENDSQVGFKQAHE